MVSVTLSGWTRSMLVKHHSFSTLIRNKKEFVVNKSSPVELAAQRLIRRYYRRFPQVHWSKWDVQSIKDQKWYRNIPRLIAARTRLGGASF